MISTPTDNAHAPPDSKPLWGAVISMMLGVFALVTAEFLPVSLLTPMAADLHISESLAGQAVSTTAVLGFTASLLVPGITSRLDRRRVLLSFSVLLIIANLLVAFAPNFSFLLAGRVLLGIGLGGFWAMSTAIVMRLVLAAHLARALSITFGGWPSEPYRARSLNGLRRLFPMKQKVRAGFWLQPSMPPLHRAQRLAG